MRPLALSAFLLSLGCAGLLGDEKDPDDPSPDGDADTDADADADADADGDADSDADSDTDADADLDACSPFDAVQDGRRWVWDYGAGGMSGTQTSEIVDWDGASGVMEGSLRYSGGSYSAEQAWTSEFHCDGGLVTEHQVATAEGVSYGTPFSYTYETTYTAAGPVWPFTLAPGDRWTVRYAGTTVSNPGGPSSFDYTLTYEVEGQERVDVEAGTWDGWRITTTTSGISNSLWVVEDVGVVRTDSTELVSLD